MRTHKWIMTLGSLFGLLVAGCVIAPGAELKAVSPRENIFSTGTCLTNPYHPGGSIDQSPKLLRLI